MNRRTDPEEPIPPDLLPKTFFAPLAVHPAGEYRQWNVVDGEAPRDEGEAYLLRSAGETELRVRIELEAGPTTDRTLAFSVGGSAGPEHLVVLDESPIQVPAGSTSVELRVMPIQAGRWYREKLLVLRLLQAGSTGLKVDSKRAELRLYVRPSVVPPTVDWDAAGASGGPGQHTVRARLSAPALEDVKVYYTISGTLDPSDFTIAPGCASGELTVPAGDLEAELDFTIGAGAGAGETLEFATEHESSVGVGVAGHEVLHANENSIHFTGDWSLDVGPFDENKLWPSTPTIHLTGGISDEDLLEGKTGLEILEQPEVLAPDGAHPQGIVISEYHNTDDGVAYVREGFEDQYACGGPEALKALGRYVRGALRLARFSGADAWRNARFFRVTLRNRSKDVNHFVTIDTQSDGTDMNGEPTQTWQLGGETWGLWQADGFGPGTSIGATQQVFDGEGPTKTTGEVVNTFWFVHELDEVTVYRNGRGGGVTEEPGDLGLFIWRPVWTSSSDGTAVAWRRATQSRGYGTIAYWPWFETGNNAYAGPPTQFWHKPGRWWEPRGGAAQAPGDVLVHVFTVTA